MINKIHHLHHETHLEFLCNLYLVCHHNLPVILFQSSIFQNSKCPKFQVSSRKGQRSKYTAFPLSLVALIFAWINGIFQWVTHISITIQYMCNIPELHLSHATGIKVLCYICYSKLSKIQCIIKWNLFYFTVNSGFHFFKVFNYITN